LDGVLDYLPAPTDIPPIEGIVPDSEETTTRPADDNEPFSALAFKVMTDPYVGKLTFFRVYFGVLTSGSYVRNTVKGKKKRIGRILKLKENSRNEFLEINYSVISHDVYF